MNTPVFDEQLRLADKSVLLMVLSITQKAAAEAAIGHYFPKASPLND